jgi:hypothetical protein
MRWRRRRAKRRSRQLRRAGLRNTAAMHAGQRCGAATRTGHACMSPAVGGSNRCRMHGGAPGSGAPLGNRNAFKHGHYAQAAYDVRRQMRDFARLARQVARELR